MPLRLVVKDGQPVNEIDWEEEFGVTDEMADRIAETVGPDRAAEFIRAFGAGLIDESDIFGNEGRPQCP